jgi:DUF917 family protein
MPLVLSTRDDLEDLATGLAFYGTGGGGRAQTGIDMLLPIFDAGQSIVLHSADELPPETWICWVLIIGGRDPDTPPPADELRRFGLLEEKFSVVERLAEAARELAAFHGVRLGALASMELSSVSTSATILTAAALGVPVLDSDFVGRAIPEVGLTKLDLQGHSPTPVAMVDRWGTRLVLKSSASAAMSDRIGRMISRAAYGRGVGAAGHFLHLNSAAGGLVRGSLIAALKAGRVLRSGTGRFARLAALTALTGGRILFEGEAIKTEWLDHEPYMFRELIYEIAGRDDFTGQHCRIWVKNEHHIVWRDNVVVATSPDIIAVLDAGTNLPLTTLGDVTPGRKILVFATKALDPVWHSELGLALLGPAHFGFSFGYVPFDERL